MPFTPQVFQVIAQGNANIVIDAASASPQEIITVVNLWARSTGTVTIRNAGNIPPANIAAIVNMLRNRLTLEE